jgi:L-asparagine transporter-like permease
MTDKVEDRKYSCVFAAAYLAGLVLAGLTMYAYWAVSTKRWFWSLGIVAVILLAQAVPVKHFTGSWAAARQVTLAALLPPLLAAIACIVLFQVIGLGGKAVPPPKAETPANANVAPAKPKANANVKANTNQ